MRRIFSIAGLLLALFCAITLASLTAWKDTFEVWVTDQASDKVLIIDGLTHKLLSEIEVDDDGQPATSKPHFVSFSPDSKYAYVANVGKHNVTIIDALQRKVITQIAAGKGAHAAIASPDGKRVWVANPGDGSITEILVEGSVFTPGRTFASGGVRTMVLAFSHDGRLAYVTNSGDASATESAQTGSIVVIDVASGQVIKQLEKTGKNTLVPVWSADGQQLYVSVGDPVNQILTLPASGVIEEMIFGPTDVGVKDAHGVAVAPDGKLVLVARQETKVQLFDSSLTNLGSIETGEKPDMIALSPNGQKAYVTLRGQAVTGDPFALSGTTPGLAILDLTLGKRVDFVSISGDPHGVAVRASSGITTQENPRANNAKKEKDWKHWLGLFLIGAVLGFLIMLFLKRP